MAAPDEEAEQLDLERHGRRFRLVQREAGVALGARAQFVRLDASLETDCAEEMGTGRVHGVHQDLVARHAHQVLGNLVLEQVQIQAHADRTRPLVDVRGSWKRKPRA